MGHIKGSNMAGKRVGGCPGWWVVSKSLSGACFQNYTSYGYEILWVDRSYQRGVQCIRTLTLAF